MTALVASAEFDALVAAHGGEALAVCRAILRDEHLGADAAQEALLRLWRRSQAGRAPDKPGAWLRQVAITSALELSRARAAQRTEGDGALDLVPDSDAGVLERISRAELAARFERALAELPEGQRTVFLLRHEAGLSLTDVAQALDVSRETVKTQFARAVLKLQSRLAAHAPGRDGR
jgi:RNA polymerase sigma-70 factor (ECF subfamily)